jgi:predicted DNA-binding protein
MDRGFKAKESGVDQKTARIANCMTIHYNELQEALMPTARRSRVFTISMPPEMAASAKFLAKKENRTMSELMREAFRTYNEQQVARFIDEMGEYAKTRNPMGYTEEDIPRLVKEVRAEMRAEREAKLALVTQ